MNIITLIGNSTKELEGRTINGKDGPLTTVDLPIAINRGKDASGNEITDFFDISVFGVQAENLLKYCGKGSKVAISGHLKQNRWTDQETGKGRSRLRIIADRVEYLNMKPVQAASQQPQPQTGYQGNNYQAQPGNYQAQPGNYQAQTGNYQAQPNGNYQAQNGNYQTQPNGNYQPQAGYQQNTVGGGQFEATGFGVNVNDEDINF